LNTLIAEVEKAANVVTTMKAVIKAENTEFLKHTHAFQKKKGELKTTQKVCGDYIDHQLKLLREPPKTYKKHAGQNMSTNAFKDEVIN
jgi:hypothetical protein